MSEVLRGPEWKPEKPQGQDFEKDPGRKAEKRAELPPKKSIKVRKMEARDLDQVIKIGLSTPEIQTGTGSPQFYFRETLENWIQSPNGILLVAEDARRIIGFRIASYNPDSRDGHLHVTAVKEQYRRLGIGSKLLDDTLNRLEELGANHVYCEVQEDNENTLRFFRKHGFEIGNKFYRVERNLPRS